MNIMFVLFRGKSEFRFVTKYANKSKDYVVCVVSVENIFRYINKHITVKQLKTCHSELRKNNIKSINNKNTNDAEPYFDK